LKRDADTAERPSSFGNEINLVREGEENKVELRSLNFQSSSAQFVMRSMARAASLLLLLLALLALPRTARAQCTGPGRYGYGGSGAGCASCAAGAGALISASAGCLAPDLAQAPGLSATAFYLSGMQDEGSAAFSALGAAVAGGISYTVNHRGVANGAMSVPLGAALQTPPLAQLPTGSGARSISLWLKCPPPMTPMGRTIIDFWDGSAAGGLSSEHFAVTAGLAIDSQAAGAAGIVMNNGALQQGQFAYTSSTLAGKTANTYLDGVGSNAGFSNPVGVAADLRTGAVYVADQNNFRLRKVNPNGNVSTVAGGAVAGNLDGVGSNALFSAFQGVAVDPMGAFIIVADLNNNNVRYVNMSTLNVTTLAGCKGSGVGTGCASATLDGTGASAQFAGPDFVTMHPTNGNAFIACNYASNVRQVSPLGVVTTVAGSYTGASGYVDAVGTNARFNTPRGIAADPSGSYLVVADSSNCVLRKVVLATGAVTTMFGTAGVCVDQDGANALGLAATFNNPRGVAFDAAGNIYVADYSALRVRKISPQSGLVATIAGSIGVSGTVEGVGTNIAFVFPMELTVDALGNVIVVDPTAGLLRKLAPPPSAVSYVQVPVCDGQFWHQVQVMFDGINVWATVDGDCECSSGGLCAAPSSNHRFRSSICPPADPPSRARPPPTPFAQTMSPTRT